MGRHYGPLFMTPTRMEVEAMQPEHMHVGMKVRNGRQTKWVFKEVPESTDDLLQLSPSSWRTFAADKLPESFLLVVNNKPVYLVRELP